MTPSLSSLPEREGDITVWGCDYYYFILLFILRLTQSDVVCLVVVLDELAPEGFL